MPEIKENSSLPDTQNENCGYPAMHIEKVGIKNVNVPLSVLKKDGTINTCSSKISLFTDLTAKCKGTNMSRYRIIIENLLIKENLILDKFVPAILNETAKTLQSANAYIKIAFPYYLTNQAPASKLISFIDLNVILEGKLVDGIIKEYLTVVVPYTSCCPCSKKISSYGAHNQRSFATIKVELNRNFTYTMWIEDVYDMVNKVASAPIINGLKRADEAYQTELMYENPKFVEDMVRLLGMDLNQHLDNKILDYCIIVEHEESIHTHDAVAILTAGRSLK